MSKLEIEVRETCLGHVTGNCKSCKHDENNKYCNLGYQPVIMRIFEVHKKTIYEQIKASFKVYILRVLDYLS